MAAACDESQPVSKNEEPQTDTAEFVPAAPGTVMAADSVVVPESPNKFHFKVKVLANEYTKKGTYTISVVYGPDSNSSMFTMPKGAAHLLPVMKRAEGYSYIIGFVYREQFYEYYNVTFRFGRPHTTKVSLVKAYVLE